MKASRRAADPDSGKWGHTPSMSLLTIEQIDQKITTAQERFDHADDDYGRNVSARIRDEYKAYRAERLKKLEQARA